MKHRSLVHALLLLWGMCACRLVYSATFVQEVMLWDYQSLVAGAVAGLLGGLLRTIYALQVDDRAVFAILSEARKDLVVSFIAGGFAYLLMITIESKWPGTITREVRFLGVLAAGWTRTAIFANAARLVRAKVDGKARALRDGAEEPPTSAAVPLEK